MSEKLYGILLQEAIPSPDKPQKIKNLVVNKEAKELLEKQSKEIERLNNILDNIGYQIEGIIRTTENLGITKYTGEVISKHNIEILKNVIKMIETKDVSIGSDKEWNIGY